jgi:dTDP-4-dehydrorhamnose 3,5-epimerase
MVSQENRETDGMVSTVCDVLIEGIRIVPLRQIPDHRGTVYHMLKATDPHFIQFGEVYFSSIYPGVVKAWKLHERVTVNYACIFGRIKLVLYDEREDSKTRGILNEVFLSPDHYSLVVIPPRLWHGFQGMSHPAAIVANCASEPNDPSELVRLAPGDKRIPYNWGQNGPYPSPRPACPGKGAS